MKALLKLTVLMLPISFILMFFVLLTDDTPYPGADYDVFDMPQFQLKNLQDNELIFNSDIQGDYIVNIWASWCITCRIEHPYLMNLSKQGMPIIGLNYKDERRDAIDWLEKYGNPYETVIHDLKGTLALDMGVTGAPETFLVNNGEIVAHFQGEINPSIWEDVFMPIIDDREMF